jgi:ubiquinone/menaquinone biosynthesis C-methylase UbiE
MSKISRLGEVAAGALSLNPLKRIQSLELLLSYLLSRLPENIKNEHLHIAAKLPDVHLRGSRLFTDRASLLNSLPKGGRVAEVGTWRGDFSSLIANVCRPDEFHLLDIDFSPLKEDRVRSALQGGSLHKHLGDSAKTLGSFPAAHFDWIYIDGDHTYAGVKRDLAAAHRVLKPGGYMMCNDYTNWDVKSAQPYGVAKAVNEMILAENYQVLGLAFEPAGYHDILLQKLGG